MFVAISDKCLSAINDKYLSAIDDLWLSAINDECLSAINDEYLSAQSINQLSGMKGTVSEISSDSPCKENNIRFSTVPLKALSEQV